MTENGRKRAGTVGAGALGAGVGAGLIARVQKRAIRSGVFRANVKTLAGGAIKSAPFRRDVFRGARRGLLVGKGVGALGGAGLVLGGLAAARAIRKRMKRPA